MTRAETFPMVSAADASDWIGRSEERWGSLTPELAGMLDAAVSHPASTPRDLRVGSFLPCLWHWAAFPEFAPLSGLGPDGHPKLGEFLPPLDFQRRMWAAGKLNFSGALRIGEPLRRRSVIRAITPKTGSGGDMVFVRVDHQIEGETGAFIEEQQDIVYLDIPDTFVPPKRIPVPEDAQFDETVTITEARLFRYSAATYNAHRIHYDLPYTREVEKYPGLLTHGPMQATMLMEAAKRHTGRRPKRFQFRGVHPMFHTHDLRLLGRKDASGRAIDLGTAAPEGYLGMQARAEWD
ncbi:MAG: acyl dehydratase [Roseicyclus sp.]